MLKTANLPLGKVVKVKKTKKEASKKKPAKTKKSK